jgi:hypothetical protein
MTTILVQPLGRRGRVMLGAALAAVVALLLFVGLDITVLVFY